VEDIVRAAITTPSGDNCQPWEFHWDGSFLDVYHSDTRAAHAINLANMASRLAFGCVLEAIEIAAHHHGYLSSVTLNVGGSHWGKISFRAGEGEKGHLYAQLWNRATNRKMYLRGSLEPIFRQIVKPDEDDSGCKMYILGEPDPELRNRIADAETLLLRTPIFHRDLMKWIRWSDSETELSRDGLGWRQLGISFLESRIFKFARNYSVQRVLNALGFLSQYRRNIHRQIQSSSGLVLFTSPDRGPSALMPIGRLAFKTWLRLNGAGFAVQPYSLCSLYSFCRRAGAYEATETDFHSEVILRAAAAIRGGFRIPDGEYPVWMFRTGIAPPLKGTERSLRLPLNSVFHRA